MINVTFQISREKVIFPLNDTETIEHLFVRKKVGALSLTMYKNKFQID